MSKFIKAADIKALTKNISKMEYSTSGTFTKRQNKIITIGDSITRGSYPGLLQMMFNAQEATYNYQAPGFQSGGACGLDNSKSSDPSSRFSGIQGSQTAFTSNQLSMVLDEQTDMDKTWRQVQDEKINSSQTDSYKVENYGVSYTTMNSKGDMPYIARPEYQKALNSSPDTVVIQLGTNDSKPHNWDMEQYVADYMKMVMSFMKLESKPEIFLMVPPPLYIEGICHLRQCILNDTLYKLVPMIGKKLGLDESHIIDNFSALGGHDLSKPELFHDGIHPNDDGYAVMAQNVFNAVTSLQRQKRPTFHARL